MEHKIGAQTITWGEHIKEKMAEILSFLGETGFQGVETGMRHFHRSDADYYRNLYSRTGIVPLGLHSGGQFWEPGAADAERKKLWDSLEFAQSVNFRWMVVSGNKNETVDSMREAAKTYSQIGSRCRKAGLRFAYHNHDWELADDGEILDVLLRSTVAEDVSLVLDVAWAYIGGLEVRDLLERYGDRIAYLHIKDVQENRFCELGSGEMDLEMTFNLADRFGIEWLVVEQDYTSQTPELSMRENRQFLSRYGW